MLQGMLDWPNQGTGLLQASREHGGSRLRFLCVVFVVAFSRREVNRQRDRQQGDKGIGNRSFEPVVRTNGLLVGGEKES